MKIRESVLEESNSYFTSCVPMWEIGKWRVIVQGQDLLLGRLCRLGHKIEWDPESLGANNGCPGWWTMTPQNCNADIFKRIKRYQEIRRKILAVVQKYRVAKELL